MQITMIWGRICLRNQNTHFMFNNFFFSSDRAVSDNVVKCGTAGQATNDNISRRRRDVICMLNN
jgi:hypothetical protein